MRRPASFLSIANSLDFAAPECGLLSETGFRLTHQKCLGVSRRVPARAQRQCETSSESDPLGYRRHYPFPWWQESGLRPHPLGNLSAVDLDPTGLASHGAPSGGLLFLANLVISPGPLQCLHC